MFPIIAFELLYKAHSLPEKVDYQTIPYTFIILLLDEIYTCLFARLFYFRATLTSDQHVVKRLWL